MNHGKQNYDFIVYGYSLEIRYLNFSMAGLQTAKLDII